MGRWIRFLIAILAGIGIGLAYGWLIAPGRSNESMPGNLRVDFKTDYVLMIAEAYQGEADLDMALRRLALLGDTPPADQVYQAIAFGQKAAYTQADIAHMQALLEVLQAQNPSGATAPP